MKVETRTTVQEREVFIAEDGTEFNTEKACLLHEWEVTANAVYLVTSRGQRADNSEIYSSKELANRAIGTSTNHTITKVLLDRRFWDKPEIGVDWSKEFLEEARAYFFDKEGYMASDRICINYWYEHHD